MCEDCYEREDNDEVEADENYETVVMVSLSTKALYDLMEKHSVMKIELASRKIQKSADKRVADIQGVIVEKNEELKQVTTLKDALAIEKGKVGRLEKKVQELEKLLDHANTHNGQ